MRHIARVILGDLEAAIYETSQLNPNAPSSDGPFVVFTANAPRGLEKDVVSAPVELNARQAGLLADFCRAASFAGGNRRR
jgi:hypothetical protein